MALPGQSSTVMNQNLCERFGFDDAKIVERLGLLGLTGPDVHAMAEELQSHVIQPNIDSIVDAFYDTIGCNPEFIDVVREHSDFSKLKMTQRLYLLNLGENIDTPEYFEERLQVGAAHQRVGVSLTIYQCAYRLLQSLLIKHIPDELKSSPETCESLTQFILKITALDMSLAIETYYTDKVISLQQSIDSIRNEGELLRKSLNTDTLTKLYSRAYAIKELKRALAEVQQEHRPLCVVMADLDHFKSVNDRHGHLVGDQVLRAVARRMVSGARDKDTFGRYGGEEFILILEDTPLAGARVVAERIRQRVGDDPVHVKDVNLAVTMSLGVAEARANDTAEMLAARADHALYAAKAGGRNRVQLEEDAPETADVGPS
jgi:two-component system cell cycle response regulator